MSGPDQELTAESAAFLARARIRRAPARDWEDLAACGPARMDPAEADAIFFPASSGAEALTAAAQVCAGCDVLADCAAHHLATEHPLTEGFAAGAPARVILLARRAARPVPPARVAWYSPGCARGGGTCKHGHPRTEENTGTNGVCLACRRAGNTAEARRARRARVLARGGTCKHGHPRTEENTGTNGNCLACRRAAWQAQAKCAKGHPLSGPGAHTDTGRCAVCYETRGTQRPSGPLPALDPEDERHGSHTGYLAGCRQGCCRAAHAAYMQEWRARRPGAGR